MILVKKYSVNDFLNQYELLDANAEKRILNVGSSSVRYGSNCVNIDIQNKPDIDFVCDVHDLSESLGKFDVVICNAMLQYCYSPTIVAEQFYKVLNEGGLLFVDAPWMQPYCMDTIDRFRFSKHQLEEIFSDFKVLKTGESITSGSAFVFFAIKIAKNLTSNKYINFLLGKVVGILLLPLCWLTTIDESNTAGAFFIVCQKVSDNDRE